MTLILLLALLAPFDGLVETLKAEEGYRAKPYHETAEAYSPSATEPTSKRASPRPKQTSC